MHFPLYCDCLEAIGASKCEVMSVLDLRDAYHTLPLAEESQKYCGLTPYYGSPTYVYLRMGMGMSCSPALWQQFVHIIWEQLPNKERYKIIMDDILIFSTKEEHWEDLANLFEVLIRFGLKISPHKCQLFRDKLVYMGLEFLIKDGTAHYTAMRDKCDAIRNMKAPKSVKECRTFCGMVNFLSTFCKNLQQLLIPIYELTKKHARFLWTDKHQKAFEEIKQLLVKPPVLRMVSGNGFFSRTAAWRLERIDTRSPKQVHRTPVKKSTKAHLLIPPQDKLSLFRKHIPKQQEIDALLKKLHKRVLHNLMVNLDTKDLIESYTKSLRYREIYNYVADGRLPGNAITQKKIAGEAANYVVVNGLLFKIAQHKESGKWTHYLLLVIPEKFEANILNMYHNSLLAMHQGPYRTFLTMRKQFYFPNMLPKIQKYIEACTLCQ